MRYGKVSFWILIILFLVLHSAAAQSGGSIAYGETVTGTITDAAPVQAWTFEGQAGDVVTITMDATDLASGGLDSYLQLLDPAGEVLIENDDASATTINAAIADFTLPEDGTYTIHATRFGLETGLATGEYELTLLLVTGGEGGDTGGEGGEVLSDAQPIAYDSPVSGTLTRQNYEDAWTFEGQAGEVISIRMERVNELADLDPFLRLLDNENRELTRNDDAADGLHASEIVGFELPYTGTYTVIATRYGFESGTSAGDYTLEIHPGGQPSDGQTTPTQEPPSDDSGTQVIPGGTIQYGDFVTDTLSGDNLTYQFEGQTDDKVTISVKRHSGNLNPSLQLLDGNGNILAENAEFNGAADARITEATLPTDGTYNIVIGRDTSAAGEFVLHLFSAGSEAQAAPTEAIPPVEALPEVDLSNATYVITLSWQGTADFDLSVVDPNGDTIDYVTPQVASGGIFAGDANAGCVPNMAQPSETIYWESEPPAGIYTIGVAFVFPCADESPVSYTITITRNGEVVETIEDELSEGNFKSYERSLE
jgi:hypothetical protein